MPLTDVEVALIMSPDGICSTNEMMAILEGTRLEIINEALTLYSTYMNAILGGRRHFNILPPLLARLQTTKEATP